MPPNKDKSPARSGSQSHTQSDADALFTYPLFQLSQVLRFQTEGHARGEGVSIDQVAMGGFKGREYVALSLTNDFLVVRYRGSIGPPVVRMFPWHREPLKRIAALDFCPSGLWLLITCVDGTIYLVPVHSLVGGRDAKKDYEADEATNLTAGSDTYANATTPAESNDGLWPRALPSLMTYAQSWTTSAQTRDSQAWTLDDATTIHALTKSKPLGVSKCLWWRRWDGIDYAVVATKNGSIHVVDIKTGTTQSTIRLSHPVVNMQLVVDPGKSFKYIFVSTHRGGYIKLLLESEIDYHTYETLITHSGSDDFMPRNLSRKIPPTSIASVQHTKRGPVIAVHHPSTHKYEVFDAELNRFALYVYQLFPGCSCVHLTDKLVLVVGGQDGAGASSGAGAAGANLGTGTTSSSGSGSGSSGGGVGGGMGGTTSTTSTKIMAISCLIAGTSSDPHWFFAHQRESIMQEFNLPIGTEIVAFLGKHPSAPVQQNIFVSTDFNINRSASGVSTDADVDLGAETDDTELLVLERNGLLVLKAKEHPSVIFKSLVHSDGEQQHAEALGKTMGLDLLGLYEQCADEAFRQEEYDQALHLYSLSSAPQWKIAIKFVEVGRIDKAITLLKQTLAEPHSIHQQIRIHLSDLLMKCFVLLTLSGDRPVDIHELNTNIGKQKGEAELDQLDEPKPKYVLDFDTEQEFGDFLATNEYYNSGQALLVLIENGLSKFAMFVGNARKLVPKVLEMMADRGQLLMAPECLDYLIDNGHSEALKIAAGGAFFRCLDTHTQTKLLVANPASLNLHARSIPHAIVGLPIETLILVASVLDPDSERYRAVASAVRQSLSMASDTQTSALIDTVSMMRDSAVSLDELMEIYIEVLLVIAWKRRSHRLSQPVQDVDEEKEKAKDGADSEEEVDKGKGSSESKEEKEEEKEEEDVMLRNINAAVVSSVACGSAHTLLVMSDGSVLSFGRNTHGQLGLGDQKRRTAPHRVMNLDGIVVVAVGAGEGHSVALDHEGYVYSWGSAQRGQLGLNSREAVTTPHRIPRSAFNGNAIKHIASGAFHTAAVTEDGDLYMWGWGEHGQLGLSDTSDSLVPHRVDAIGGQRIDIAACGYCHTAAVTLDDRELLTWGNGQYGQLGQGDLRSRPLPQVVHQLQGKPISSLSCGSFHTVVTSDIGGVYSWGRGGRGRLGLANDGDVCIPQWVEALRGYRVSSVSAGHWFTLCITDSGELLLFGIIDSNQSDHVAAVPHKLEANVKSASSGEEYAAFVSTDGEILTWGRGDEGQLGHGGDTVASRSRTSPTVVQGLHNTTRQSFVQSPTMMGMNMHKRRSGSRRLKSKASLSLSQRKYDQTALECALRDRFRGYRAPFVIDRALDWDNPGAAAVIKAMLRQWPESFALRLQEIAQIYTDERQCQITADESNDKNAEANTCLRTLQDVTPHFEVADRIEIPSILFKHWRVQRLPISLLEEYLLEHIDYWEASLCDVLTSSSDSDAYLLAFSPFFYLKLAQHRAGRPLEDARAYEARGQASAGNLWRGIRVNLEKDLNAYSFAVIPSPGAGIGSFSGVRAVFTCGHTYNYTDLYTRVLAELVSRVAAFPAPIPMTLRLIMAQYNDGGNGIDAGAVKGKGKGKGKSKDIAMEAELQLAEAGRRPNHCYGLACPVCVYSTLRREQGKRFPASPPEPWEVSL